jgi:hypothetical protein
MRKPTEKEIEFHIANIERTGVRVGKPRRGMPSNAGDVVYNGHEVKAEHPVCSICQIAIEPGQFFEGRVPPIGEPLWIVHLACAEKQRSLAGIDGIRYTEYGNDVWLNLQGIHDAHIEDESE